MTLLALQNNDIHRSIISAINVVNYAAQATHVELVADQVDTQYVLIEVTCDEKNNTLTSQAANRLETTFKARPVFPNSLLSTEVCITPVMHDVTPPPHDTNTTVHPSHGMLDYPVERDLHYRIHDTLPNYLGKQLYRNCAHIVGILEKESSLGDTDTTLVDEIRFALNTSQHSPEHKENLDTLLFIDDPRSQLRQEYALRQKSLNIRIRRLAHHYHRLNVIGKASLVLCDSAGIAVDAIRSSVPVVFVNRTPLGYEKLQACALRFLQHMDYQRLVDEQKFELDDLVQSHSQHEYILSNQRTLHALIAAYSACADPVPENIRLTIAETKTQQQHDLILSSQQSLYVKPDNSVRLTSTLESSRRKFQKFKESPTRFVEDSQNRILRTLFSSKTSQ